MSKNKDFTSATPMADLTNFKIPKHNNIVSFTKNAYAQTDSSSLWCKYHLRDGVSAIECDRLCTFNQTSNEGLDLDTQCNLIFHYMRTANPPVQMVTTPTDIVPNIEFYKKHQPDTSDNTRPITDPSQRDWELEYLHNKIVWNHTKALIPGKYQAKIDSLCHEIF